jgi:hypothetical protein
MQIIYLDLLRFGIKGPILPLVAGLAIKDGVSNSSSSLLTIKADVTLFLSFEKSIDTFKRFYEEFIFDFSRFEF